MGTAVGGVYIICESQQIFVVALVVLHSDLDRYGVLLIFGGKVNNVGMNYFQGALFVDILNKALYTALVVEVVLQKILVVSLVAQLDMYARVQESLLAQTALQNGIFINRSFLKNLGVCLKAHLGALYIRLSYDLKLVYYFAALITLKINILAVTDLDLQPLRQRVYYRRANAVQTAGHLVSAAAELAARVQHGKYYRYGGKTGFAVDANRNTASVVVNADDISLFNNDFYL